MVRQARTTGKAYPLPDIDGLSLAVTPAGNKSWHFRYYWPGRQKRMSLGKRSIYDIKRPDLLEVIAKIEKRKALSVTEKVRTWFDQLFRYALVIVPGLEQNPASDLGVVALPLPPVNHNPFLRMADLPKLLRLRLRRMMQDWAERLDLFEQNQVQVASMRRSC